VDYPQWRFANLDPNDVKGIADFRNNHPDFAPQSWWNYRPNMGARAVYIFLEMVVLALVFAGDLGSGIRLFDSVLRPLSQGRNASASPVENETRLSPLRISALTNSAFWLRRIMPRN
jgi:hypothetical protein